MENSEVRELRTEKRDAIHEASKTNTVQERHFREQAFLTDLILVLTLPAPSPSRFYSVLGHFLRSIHWAS